MNNLQRLKKSAVFLKKEGIVEKKATKANFCFIGKTINK